jgi:hypothetical protein
MKKLYENEKYQFQREKPRASRAQKFGFAPYLRPTGGGALGRRAQVGRKWSHEQNRLMRTKVRPALGKTTLIIHNAISFSARSLDEISSKVCI